MKRWLVKVLIQVMVWIVVLLTWLDESHAQVQIDKRKPLAPGALVQIENDYGTLVINGWEKNEIWVKGTLAPGAERGELDTGVDEDEEEHGKRSKRSWASFEVETPNSWSFESDDDSDYRSTIEVFVPRSAEVHARSVNAAIEVRGVTGGVALESINGTLRATGPIGEFQAQTLTGAIELEGSSRSTQVETVNGPIRLSGLTGEVQVETVAGEIHLRGDKLAELVARSTSGAIQIEGTLAAESEWSIETFSGAVTLTLNGQPEARFRFRSAQGQIASSLGPKPRREERFNPFKLLEFTTGDNSEVEVETYSGPITLKAAAPAGEKR